ncbi:DUF2726 domain-containing protein [Acinetobacter stercoris]|uniref:DUF2726 domain-containing protein n=1 Tax=Acinetobacter stercoris TaxID=2126983 RepID=A0A2U3MYL3_9GAMM|nr:MULTISPECIES: DUF2726 domain-containing protein [Acinetobacter]SPL70464.1 hypothetical protein KPC_1642 [Acinetobacter stercoris]
MNIIIIVSMILLTIAILVVYKNQTRKRPADSVLRQRAVLNSQAQITLIRLKEILTGSTVLAQVSFDALLTTKYLHTRHKYQNMVADFVVLDKDFQVIAIVALDDISPSLKRIQQDKYQDNLLQMAGYRVIRYRGIPDEQQLRLDFMSDFNSIENIDDFSVQATEKLKIYESSSRAFG